MQAQARVVNHQQQPSALPKASITGAMIPSIAGTNSEADRLTKIRQLEAEEMSRQQKRMLMGQMQNQMMTQANQLLTGWGTNNPQRIQKVVTHKNPAITGAGGDMNPNMNANNGPTIKAGSILFAVLDTSVDSDNPGPIMATIVAGKLKGAKLIGQFSLTKKKLLLTFNVLNIPGVQNSVSINAVAIDENTAQTAISGHVNNHYLLRYGTLFASSFISGYADALSNAGSTSVTGPLGLFSVKSTTKLTTEQQMAVAAGNVGSQYAQKMGQNFDTPPTVTINSGVGMGILVMSDFQLPKRASSNGT